jgi:hypothetical protein
MDNSQISTSWSTSGFPVGIEMLAGMRMPWATVVASKNKQNHTIGFAIYSPVALWMNFPSNQIRAYRVVTSYNNSIVSQNQKSITVVKNVTFW